MCEETTSITCIAVFVGPMSKSRRPASPMAPGLKSVVCWVIAKRWSTSSIRTYGI